MDKISSKCICRAPVVAKIKTPKRFSVSVAKAECMGCKSRYQFTSELASGSGPEKYNIGVSAIEITDIARNEAKKNLENEKAAI